MKRLEFLALLSAPLLLPAKGLVEAPLPAVPLAKVSLPHFADGAGDCWTIVEVHSDYITIEASRTALAAHSGPCMRFGGAGTVSLRNVMERDVLQATFFSERAAKLVDRVGFEQPINFQSGDTLELAVDLRPWREGT